jgi:ribonuclease HI
MSATGCTGCTGWAHAAAKREWGTTRRKPLANRQLWERLLELDGRLVVSWRHVRGHRPKKDTSDDARYNREVDALSVEARRGFVVSAPQRRKSRSRSWGENSRLGQRAGMSPESASHRGMMRAWRPKSMRRKSL